MLNKTIEEITTELLNRSGLNIPILIENHFPNGRLVGGKYSVGTNSITMYLETVKEQCVVLFGSVADYLNCYAIVLAHEIGHAMDDSLKTIADLLDVIDKNESKTLIREAEEKAWKNARQILFDIDETLFITIRDKALEIYI